MTAHCAPDQSRVGTRRTLKLLSIAALGVTLTGCEREAPGPGACGELAQLWVERAAAVTRYAPRALQPHAGAHEAEIEEIARVCVTMPFDRQVITCAEQGGGPEYCLQRFADRRRRHDGR